MPRKQSTAKQSTAKPSQSTARKKPAKKSSKKAAKKKAAKASASKPTRAPARKSAHTPDFDRGSQFLTRMSLWRILHEDGGRTIYDKTKLAEAFYGSLSLASILPEEEATHASRVEAKKRTVQRLLLELQKAGVAVINCDELGNEQTDSERENLTKSKKKLYWRYDAHANWSKKFDAFLKKSGITPYEFTALATLSDMLDTMKGAPQTAAVEKLLERLKGEIPPDLVDDAREIGAVYRCAVSTRSKYEAFSNDLNIFYQACLDQKQIEFEYKTPGNGTKRRRLAPATPLFDREDSAIYILGHEYDEDKQAWSDVKQFKVDRIVLNSTKLLKQKNPPPTEFPEHPRVKFSGSQDGPLRLDRDHLYYESAGAYFETHRPAIALEVLIRPPATSQKGPSQAKKNREAANWMCWVEEKPFHRNQVTIRETDEQGNEQLRLKISRCNETEMASRLLRMGDCFEVVSPQSLKTAVQTIAQGILDQHGLA